MVKKKLLPKVMLDHRELKYCHPWLVINDIGNSELLDLAELMFANHGYSFIGGRTDINDLYISGYDFKAFSSDIEDEPNEFGLWKDDGYLGNEYKIRIFASQLKRKLNEI